MVADSDFLRKERQK